MSRPLNKLERVISILTVVTMAVIIIAGVYGLFAHFLFIPNRNEAIKTLKRTVATQKVLVNNLKEENESLFLQVRWSKFLSLMLDKDTKIRFDQVDKYLKQNNIGLYEELPEKTQ